MKYVLGFIIIGFVAAVLFGRFCKAGRGELGSPAKREPMECEKERL